MSSFIGHGLMAVTAHAVPAPNRRPFSSKVGSWLWLIWLIAIAWAPDIDHVAPNLTMSQNDGMRITHALASSLLLPLLTGVGLYVLGLRKERLSVGLWQSAIAGLSHPLMDFFVGVIGLPLFWPFHPVIITAPVGLLPSAGSPHWQNYYFWANLFIELGIIAPLMMVGLGSLPWKKNKIKAWQSTVLIVIAIYFLHWSIGLSR